MILLEHIKEDWLCRLPYRLDHMKFKGLNRPAYTLLCLMYYGIKALILLYLTVMFYAYKFVLWDIWNHLFRLQERNWYQKVCEKFRLHDEEYDEDDEEYEEEETVPDEDEEDLRFCQLFKVGKDMCLLVDHIEMCPDETAFIRVVDDEGFTPLYKRKVRRDKAGNRFILFNGTNLYLNEEKTQPVIIKK